MVERACTTEQKVTVRLNPKTLGGRAAQLDGPVRVTVQSGDGTIEQDAATPNEFTAVSADTPGVTDYLVEGDADLGAGVEPISDVFRLVVEGAKAANLGMVADEPVNKA